MGQQTEREELHAAWRALTGTDARDGWQTIPVALGGPCRIRAGRYFPGNQEALLVGFKSGRLPSSSQLPQGRGFVVSLAQIQIDADSCEWVALCRQRGGELDFFSMMAVDIITTLANFSGRDDERIVPIFLTRIRAWQEFMRRSDDGVLSNEAEAGLYGELQFLRQLINAGAPLLNCIDAWEGPKDGLQDFYFGSGAIEVKSTLLEHGFPVTIGSLDQLDDSAVHPLYLAGIRLKLGAGGTTLPELISDMRDSMADDVPALAGFNTRLLHAGYFNEFVERYIRRFTYVGSRILAVNAEFPRLTRGSVPIAIRNVRYEIDLDLVPDHDIGLLDSLKKLGVI